MCRVPARLLASSRARTGSVGPIGLLAGGPLLALRPPRPPPACEHSRLAGAGEAHLLAGCRVALRKRATCAPAHFLVGVQRLLVARTKPRERHLCRSHGGGRTRNRAGRKGRPRPTRKTAGARARPPERVQTPPVNFCHASCARPKAPHRDKNGRPFLLSCANFRAHGRTQRLRSLSPRLLAHLSPSSLLGHLAAAAPTPNYGSDEIARAPAQKAHLRRPKRPRTNERAR